MIHFFSLLKEFYYPALQHGFYSKEHRKAGLFLTLLCLLFRAKFNNERDVTVKLFGFEITANSPQTLLRLIKEIFLEQVYLFQTTNPSPRIIDGGANMGISVLYFKSLYPKAHITAIEPNPTAFFYLEKNIALNALSDVEAVPACLSNRKGKERFYVSPSGDIINGSLYPEIGIRYLQEVESVCLSDYLAEGEVDLVKLDVEGAERQVYQDLKMSGNLTQSQQYLIEYHAMEGLPDIDSEMVHYFEDHGFYSLSKKSSSSYMDNQNRLMHFAQQERVVPAW